MTIEHSDNTTEEFDFPLHFAQTYHKNENLVNGLMRDDSDLLANTGIQNIHSAYNKEEIARLIRNGLKDELLFRLDQIRTDVKKNGLNSSS